MKIKFLTPLAVAVTAITPVATMVASCGNKSVTVDKKEITSGDSYTTYKFKLPTVPADKKVTINIINKTEDQEQVYFDPTLVQTSNSYLDTAEFTTDDKGNVEVPVCYMFAPTQSSSSNFGLTFTYNDQTVTQTVDDLKFDYNVDYDVDLKEGNWESKITPAEASHWAGKDVAATYMNDIVNTPTIFQSDARYSTSKMIKSAIDKNQIKNLASFRAYFNNVYKDEYGLNVQMNYEVKAGANGEFEFIQLGQGEQHRGSIKYTFKNFDLTCNFSTANGYKFTWDNTNKLFNLSDETKDYDLAGRMKGKFDAVVSFDHTGGGTYEEEYNKQNVAIDDILYIEDEVEEFEWTDARVAYMFAFGIIHLTYNFDWATEEPNLQIKSSYAKNA